MKYSYVDVIVYMYIHGKTHSLTTTTISVSVGVSSGAVLVFDVPSKGSNIILSEVLEEHKEAITDLASECSGSQVWRVCLFSVDGSNFRGQTT